MNDISEVSQLVLRERQARDRGWWDRMAETYAADSHIRVSWFDGSGAEFVAKSREMTGRGDLAIHRLAPPVVWISGDRGFVEAPASIEVRAAINGVDADIASYTRLIYRVEKGENGWRIVALDPVYERDAVAPVVPGADLGIKPEDLTGFRPPYQMLSYVLHKRGYPARDDLYGDDRPAEVERLYARTWEWLA